MRTITEIYKSYFCTKIYRLNICAAFIRELHANNHFSEVLKYAKSLPKNTYTYSCFIDLCKVNVINVYDSQGFLIAYDRTYIYNNEVFAKTRSYPLISQISN